MKIGDKVWLLTARPEEFCGEFCGGDGGVIDPHSFAWVSAVVTEIQAFGDCEGAWLQFSDNSSTWYENRYIMTESAAKQIRLPENF